MYCLIPEYGTDSLYQNVNNMHHVTSQKSEHLHCTIVEACDLTRSE